MPFTIPVSESTDIAARVQVHADGAIRELAVLNILLDTKLCVNQKEFFNSCRDARCARKPAQVVRKTRNHHHNSDFPSHNH